jgi:actin related protein 2/3 complex subunit 2
MIILELANRIVKETVLRRLQAEKEVHVEMKCADFDGVMWHVFTPEENKNLLCVSVGFGAADQLLQMGAAAQLAEIYTGHEIATESMFNYTVGYDITSLTEEHEALANKLSLMRNYMVTAAMKSVVCGAPGDMHDVPLRSTAERLFLQKNESDRATVIMSIQFTDPDDAVLGNVFLKEFKKNITGAPSVDFVQGNAPRELASFNFRNVENMGFVTFVLFGRHFDKPEAATKCLDLIQLFRNYLQYHIKCSKSHLHTCMRIRVELLLQVLNRAKQELPAEKTTMSGKTFKKKN